MSLTIGVIGLGPMGGNIARLLLTRQFPVAGYDLQPERIAALDECGLRPGESGTAVAQYADVIITALPDAAALRQVVDQVLASERAGQILIESSTLALEDKLDAHRRLQAAGKILLDAPISGTPPMLAALRACVFASGDEDAYRRCLPVLQGFTAESFYVGEVGNGSKLKFLANYLVHVHTVAAAECLVLGEKAGLDPRLVHSVLRESAGGSKMFEVRGAMMAASDYREGGGTMFAIYEKDAAIITAFAAALHAPIDLYASARQKYHSALALGLGHLDTAAVCKAIETAAGIERAPLT